MQIDRDSTEYIFVGVTGQVPSTSAELAFKSAGTRPTAPDWKTATIVNNSGHALWADAVASGVSGDYYVARLIGAFGGNTVSFASAATYQVWLRLTDTTEQPVRITPNTLEIL